MDDDYDLTVRMVTARLLAVRDVATAIVADMTTGSVACLVSGLITAATASGLPMNAPVLRAQT